MSISEIKQNYDKLEELDKETLIRYINVLLNSDRKQLSKIMSLNSQIKYYNRHFTKMKDHIDKILSTQTNDDIWRNKNE
jgi:hypothetical protein